MIDAVYLGELDGTVHIRAHADLVEVWIVDNSRDRDRIHATVVANAKVDGVQPANDQERALMRYVSFTHETIYPNDPFSLRVGLAWTRHTVKFEDDHGNDYRVIAKQVKLYYHDTADTKRFLESVSILKESGPHRCLER